MTIGYVALVGGSEWQAGNSFDSYLLDIGGSKITILPTAAAYEDPGRAVLNAKNYFSGLGAKAEGLMVLNRRDAQNSEYADIVRKSTFLYLSGGSALHLRSVLKDSLLWEALVDAWHAGALLAASSAGAMVLTDPMIDPRGGAYTVGLGLIANMAVIPHWQDEQNTWAERSIMLAPRGLPLACIPQHSLLLRDDTEGWSSQGERQVEVFVDNQPAGLEVLP
ncbi:MAG: Type 1 glutamine amidotransferase-like domain-containing protein [Actinobacteria bacterium]|nr:Type 1 glutamine amidotransferase-like domain-containing protein [Actinomycetota bacterium]MCL6105601.1 Type 1 glutamine amidotransferase-like domain-containing protein [Actinomycetota bacterium]